MNKRLKKIWLKAMRTPADEGGYVQTAGTTHCRLEHPAFGDVDCFCAMGVLANEVNKQGGLPPNYRSDDGDAFINGVYSTGGFAGMTEGQVRDIIFMNDTERKSLPSIAYWVEVNL